MNEQLQTFARTTLKEGLAKLPEASVLLFKRMYGPQGGVTAEELARMDIEGIVDQMPEDKLDWAMEQVRRTLEKRSGG